MEQAKAILNGPVWFESAMSTLEGADAAVLVTEWAEFAELDLAEVKSVMASPVMVDLRNLYSAQKMKEAGFAYTGIGGPENAA